MGGQDLEPIAKAPESVRFAAFVQKEMIVAEGPRMLSF